MTKEEEQAKALISAAVSCIIADGEQMTFEDFKKWIYGTIDNYSEDEEWLDEVEEFGIKMNIIEKNARKVYGYIFVNM